MILAASPLATPLKSVVIFLSERPNTQRQEQPGPENPEREEREEPDQRRRRRHTQAGRRQERRDQRYGHILPTLRQENAWVTRSESESEGLSVI